MKKFTAILLAVIFAALCLVPSFAAAPSVTAESSFEIVPLDQNDIVDDKPVIARILNANDKVLAVIRDFADISISTIDGNSSDELKDGYKELAEADSLYDICPSLSNRYRNIFGLKKYYYNSLIVLKVFELKLSKVYADMLEVKGNKIQFAVTRVINPRTRIVGIYRKKEIVEEKVVYSWETVTKEVNQKDKLIITNPQVGTFALVVRKDNPGDDNWLWNKIVEIWVDILG